MKCVDGYKTYIVAAVMVLYAVVSMYYGILTPEAGINVIIAAGALIGIGHKIEKSVKAKQEAAHASVPDSNPDSSSDKGSGPGVQEASKPTSGEADSGR